MSHRLNTNKQFMIGNGILAFAIVVVVVSFVYLSFRLKQQPADAVRYYNEVYAISLTEGFVGDSLSVYINDSLLINTQIVDEPFQFSAGRFAEQSTLIIVDNETDKLSAFDLSSKGGQVSLVKDKDGIKLLAH